MHLCTPVPSYWRVYLSNYKPARFSFCLSAKSPRLFGDVDIDDTVQKVDDAKNELGAVDDEENE